MLYKKKLALAVGITLSVSSVLAGVPAQAARRSGGSGGGVVLQTPNPTNPLEHNNRGVELGSKQLWPDAIREHELAVQGDPYRVDFRTNLSAAHLEYGNYLRNRGRTYDAMVQYRQAMIVDPANAKADQELDNCLKKLGKDPYDFSTRKRMAEDADVSQQYDTAIVEWRKCIKMQDTGINHFELGKVLLKAGKDVDGYRELRKAVSMEWAADQKLELSACHRQLGDILKEYAYKAKESPKSPPGTAMKRLYNAYIEYRRAVLLNSADATAIRGMLECAREAVGIKPNSFENHLALGDAYLLSGDFQHARQEYEMCFKINPTRSEVDQARIAYHQYVARSPLADDALVASSVDKIRAAIDQSPTENARLYYILGRLRERQADPERAKKCYDKAWSINPHIDPDLPEAFKRLGAPKEALAARPKTPEELAKEMEEKKKAMAEVEKQKQLQELDALMESGKFEEAIARGTEQYKENPKDATIVLKIGVAHERKSSSMADGEAKKDKEINEAKAWYRLGAGLQDKTGASQQCELFLAQLDSSRAAPKIREADDLVQKGDLVSAASAYRDALIMAPRRADVHRKLGEVLDKMGDKEGARKEREEADRLDRSAAPKKETFEGRSL